MVGWKILRISRIVVSYTLFILLVLVISLELFALYNKNHINNLGKNYNKYYSELFTENMRIIWPNSIEKISDYKFITYEADATAYTGYMEVNYNSNDFTKEVDRLKNIDSTKYLGCYGNNGITKYQLLSIIATTKDKKPAADYYGFTYAITDNVSRIIYVEMESPNEEIREDYKKIIKGEYLLQDLDFSADNLKDTKRGIGISAIFVIFTLFIIFSHYAEFRAKFISKEEKDITTWNNIRRYTYLLSGITLSISLLTFYMLKVTAFVKVNCVMLLLIAVFFITRRVINIVCFRSLVSFNKVERVKS